ncbi:MAG: hypothetical protein M0Z96_07060 [Actinomycetota bacterium]|nr:hypothetical protein [Actinomycetota bacterium]
MASRGLGIAILSELTAIDAGEDLDAVVILTLEIRSKLELIWIPGASASPAVKMLVQ